jgi:hypothetical protein
MYRKVSDFFTGAAGKTLSAVEVNPDRSNQHEFHGNVDLVEVLGDPPGGKEQINAVFVYLNDEIDPIVLDSSLTWYDARKVAREERGVMRKELRLYYTSNEVMSEAAPGDLLVVARERSNVETRALVIVCESGSSVALQVSHIFGVSAEPLRFELGSALDHQLDFTTSLLLEALGYETSNVEESLLEVLLGSFGSEFPSTRDFSEFARRSTGFEDPAADPDGALIAWMEREEALFRSLERQIVAEKLHAADGDVDHVLKVAQQAFQRRKSRAGHALENHLEHLFEICGVSNSHGKTTEGKKKPDFIFPNIDSYSDVNFPTGNLRMLGVKTTCKDRWRQVLNEADRIQNKHLLTLESPISAAQLDEMARAGVQLVVPEPLHAAFGSRGAAQLLTVTAFITLVRGF